WPLSPSKSCRASTVPPSSPSTARCTSRGGSTTRRSSSSARTRSTSRSAGPGTRPCSWRRGWSCARPTTGSTPTTGTAPSCSSSEGEFWESLNTASNRKLPVLYLVEDNGYAISVPVEVQTPGGSISRLVRSFPDLLVREVDGCDPLASLAVLKEAVAWCRARRGPALVHAHVIRPYSHSLSDDETLYRTAAEREADARRDPLAAFPALLQGEGVAREEELSALRAEIDREVGAAADAALAAPGPEPRSATLWVYSPDVDPTSDAFRTE